jgi:hypothetical protein
MKKPLEFPLNVSQGTKVPPDGEIEIDSKSDNVAIDIPTVFAVGPVVSSCRMVMRVLAEL